MVLLSHSAREIWRRDAPEEIGALAREIGGVGGGEGRGRDIEDARVRGAGVGGIDGVDCWNGLAIC